MAFSTIQGSGGAPDSFVGTSGVDTILIQNVRKPVFLGGQQASDVVNWANFTTLVSGYTLKGGQGNDQIGGAITGGVGARAVAATPAITSSFINGNADADQIGLGGVSNSTVYGGQGVDRIVVTGQVSNALINSNANNDEVQVGVGAASSSIFGGQGQDRMTLAGSFLATVVQGDKDADTINIGAGLLDQTTVNGNDGADIITITAALTAFTSSTIFGGEGNDTINAANAGVGVVIYGDQGADNLTGSAEADSIFGGADNDNITGGLLADTMRGGEGVNTFFFTAAGTATAGTYGNLATGVVDVITDFKVGVTTTTGTSGDVIDWDLSGPVTTLGVAQTAADWAEVITDAAAVGVGTYVFAVGADTSFTSYLVSVTGAAGAGVIQGAIQLNGTGQYGTAALAQGAIIAGQIV